MLPDYYNVSYRKRTIINPLKAFTSKSYDLNYIEENFPTCLVRLIAILDEKVKYKQIKSRMQ